MRPVMPITAQARSQTFSKRRDTGGDCRPVETRRTVGPAVEDEWAIGAALLLLPLDNSHQLGRLFWINRNLQVPPFEPSGCSHTPRTEEQEEDHGGYVRRQVLDQSVDSFPAEEVLANSAFVFSRLLDVRPRRRGLPPPA
jgi:hypothetical protein